MADVTEEEIAPDDGFSEELLSGLSLYELIDWKDEFEPGGDLDPKEEEEEEQEEGHSQTPGSQCVFNEKGAEQKEDCPPSLTELQKLADSHDICERQFAAQIVPKVLRECSESQLHGVVSVICQLAEDKEHVVRSVLVFCIQEIAAYIGQCRPNLDFLIRQQLIPITVRALEDQPAVRTAAHQSFLVLCEQKLVSATLLDEWICPYVSHRALNARLDEEERKAAISLMCEMAPLVGKDLTLKCFLEPFSSLTMDKSLAVRKICAGSFGNFCRVVGTEITEDVLLGKFLEMCQADHGAVRSFCASPSTFIELAKVLTAVTRRSVLTGVLINLLSDESRCVKLQAYRTLGMFITTFADPGKVKHLNEDGSECVENLPCNSNSSLQGSESCSAATTCEGCNEKSDKTKNSCSQESCEEGRSLVDELPAPSSSSTDAAAAVPTSQNLNKVKSFSSSSDTGSSNKASTESPLSVAAKDGHLRVHLDNEGVFNNFQFWRLPLPEVELDIDTQNGHATSIHIRARTRDERTNMICASDFRVDISSNQSPKPVQVDAANNDVGLNSDAADGDAKRLESAVTEMLVQTASVISSVTVTDKRDYESRLPPKASDVIHSSFDEARVTLVDGELKGLKQSHSDMSSPDWRAHYNPFEVLSTSDTSVSEKRRYSSLSQDSYVGVYDQDIVPPELLERYIGMADPLLARTLDPDVAESCAYCLPGVAYTLGKENWHCLSRMCEALASDTEWKVRKTIASCLHELAKILGSGSSELLPLFLSFITDLDEVRAGLIGHLSEFLQHLPYPSRKKFLPEMKKFLKMDNMQNWRFRHMFVKQLILATKLYSHSDIEDYIYPAAMFLIRDSVSEVRLETVHLITVIVSCLSSNEASVKSVLKDLEDRYRHSQKWLWRQLYILVCQQIALQRSLPADLFATKIACTLFGLACDSVPNVRLALARCLFSVLPSEYLQEVKKLHGQMLEQMVTLLQNDVDRDVRYFASMSDTTFQNVQSN